ncbi:polysaccharide deacetylase [Calothrix sp. NIES-2098]|nr:polysaccharide deacetylase [Calothrix sp. NIES-2098]
MKVALTFDDGPNNTESRTNDGKRNCDVTNHLLDALKQTGVVATFFVVGNNVKKCGDCISKMIKEGHLVGNHTRSHWSGNGNGMYSHTSHDASAILSDIEGCNKDVYKFALEGELKREYTPRFFRCPEGKYGKEIEEACKKTGMVNVGKYDLFAKEPYHVGWSSDDNSWKSEITAEQIQNLVTGTLRDAGDKDLVILSHDHYANHSQAWTAEFIRKIKNDYNIQFVRIDELVGKRDNLEAGEYLLPGQAIESLDGKYRLVFQRDTNLVLYLEGGASANAKWATGQIGGVGEKATLTDQGEIEISNKSGLLKKFSFPHEGGEWKAGSRLVVDNNGKFKYQTL